MARTKGRVVYVDDGRFEHAMRKFKNKIQDMGLLNELKEREAYTKPTARRKKALAQAKKRWAKKLASDTLPKKNY